MLPSFKSPEATMLNRESIFTIGERSARQLGYSPDCSLFELVENMGGSVAVKDFWSEGSPEGGSLEVIKKDEFTIFIPTDTSSVRDRFTIAHELGHYVLHYLWPIQVGNKEEFCLKASRYGSDRAEWEANWFASAFLMPKDQITRLVREKATIDKISKHFNVSKQAVDIRMKTLNLDLET